VALIRAAHDATVTRSAADYGSRATRVLPGSVASSHVHVASRALAVARCLMVTRYHSHCTAADVGCDRRCRGRGGYRVCSLLNPAKAT
jgi:hypothetical protein